MMMKPGLPAEAAPSFRNQIGLLLLIACFFLNGAAAVWGQCELAGLRPTTITGEVYFGDAVAVSGDLVAVGAYWDVEGADHAGAVYVFRRTAAGWVQEPKLVAFDAEEDDEFGRAVAIDGDTLAVGAADDDDGGYSRSGSVYIYRRTGTTWNLEQKLIAPEPDWSSLFGTAVALDGDTLVASAHGDTRPGLLNAGAAYVFRRVGTTWSLEQKLTALDAAAGDRLGDAVAVDGDYVVVGASGTDDGADYTGSAYVFQFRDGVWTQLEPKLTEPTPAEDDYFGYDVTISGERVAVGAWAVDDHGTNAGMAYVYRLNGGAWTLEASFSAADAAGRWYFGTSVAMDGDRLVVGAEAANAAADHTGAAYVFERSGTTWSQIAKLATTNGVEDDEFGQAVAISGDLVVVGAAQLPGLDDYSGSAHAFAVGADCNDNGQPDLCDIADGTSGDCNENGTPDECEGDCDADGTADACETDTDGDGTIDDCDGCPDDPAKAAAGVCGCGTSDADTDGDGTPDCFDQCPDDPAKIAPGVCGCGVVDSTVDTDGDGVIDCLDNCPDAANADQADSDLDGIGDVCDRTPNSAGCGGCGTASATLTVFLTVLGVRLTRTRRPQNMRRA